MANQPKFELPALKTVDEIKADQDTIKVNLTALDEMIHANMVQCLMHCAKHRDTSLMVRLMLEVVDGDNSGYRRQGMIAWMKYFSPMRLSGKTIKLTGKDDKTGKEQSFNLEDAARTPFWKLTREGAPILRPIYQDGPLGAINRAIRDFQKAVANTNDKGLPIDESKPFYDGKNVETMSQFMVEVKKLEAVIPVDDTKDVRTAQKKQAMAA